MVRAVQMGEILREQLLEELVLLELEEVSVEFLLQVVSLDITWQLLELIRMQLEMPLQQGVLVVSGVMVVLEETVDRLLWVLQVSPVVLAVLEVQLMRVE
jgi:hypothetical protein